MMKSIFFSTTEVICIQAVKNFSKLIDTGWYGSFFGSFLVVSHWICYLISRRDCDAYFNRCNAIRLTEWLELKQNPNNLFVVPFIDQVESHIFFYFAMLWWSSPLACLLNEFNDKLILKCSRTKIKRRVSIGWSFSRPTIKILIILSLTINFIALQYKFTFLQSIRLILYG